MIRCTPIEFCENENVYVRHVWFHDKCFVSVTGHTKEELEIIDEMNFQTEEQT